ncbi:MAG TPA: methyltransferase domain-containing protein [Hyphomicrobiaceae bacterium]|nr:methyltransferase domain-containing protein [Hyphomicrobiaceae bacterium]
MSTDKKLVQAQFGKNAANYATSSVHARGNSLTRLVELVQPKRDWVMLDIATGAGHTAAAFAPHVARVIASDITPEMLVETGKLASDKGLVNIETRIADADALPFPDASFDAVTCRIAPHHFPDIVAFVAEVARVLKPGGVFGLVDNVAPGEETTPGFDDVTLREAATAYNAFEKLRDPSHGRALDSGEWRDIVGRNGLRIGPVEHLVKPMDFDAWCRNMSVDAATAGTLRAMLGAAPPALAAFLQPEERDGKLAFRLFELLLVARKGW